MGNFRKPCFSLGPWPADQEFCVNDTAKKIKFHFFFGPLTFSVIRSIFKHQNVIKFETIEARYLGVAAFAQFSSHFTTYIISRLFSLLILIALVPKPQQDLPLFLDKFLQTIHKQ